MKYLAIDTSSKRLTVIVKDGDKEYIVNDELCGVRHSETLMPTIERLIDEANLDLKSLEFVASVIGAGSFTGIRIGVSTVKAICFAFNLPFLAVTSFDEIAYNEEYGKILAVLDAGHDGFYVCGYQDKKVVLEPSYVMREEVRELSKEYTLLSDQEIEGFSVKIVDRAIGLIKAIEEKKNQKCTDLDKLIPLYVRKSQAEEGR